MDVTARRENFISTNFGVTFDACDRLDDYNVTFKDDQLNPPPRQNPFFDAVPGSVRVRTRLVGRVVSAVGVSASFQKIPAGSVLRKRKRGVTT